MQIGDYFEQPAARDIPPVVYFHEQRADEIAREVREYIITGGYDVGDHRATAEGIHEQFVRLLTHMRLELDKPGGPKDPACWISGFYGSGKSSFAKLLGLALDGRKLPDGQPLAEALVAQDRSPNVGHFRKAWADLVHGLEPVGVVFDVGAQARDAEHIHAVCVRQVQRRLGYCPTSNLVAEYELRLEQDGRWKDFEAKVRAVHKKSWDELKESQLAEDYFSAALHALEPTLYPDAQAWVNSRSGSAFEDKRAADEAAIAIERMLTRRAPGKTLFLVVDEVSQYVHDSDDRMLALQSFVSALGQRLRGKAWLLATGQQKLEDGAGAGGAIVKMKARFPPALRVHLGSSNIREVVYQRLLRKKRLLEPDLRELFDAHRTHLALYAYEADQITPDDFVEVYPLLPGHIDLLLRITSGLRSRGSRVQGDAHEIRGLLQLLGDVFRHQDLAQREPGWLLTLDRVYDVLHTALDADLHLTLNRAHDFCARKSDVLMTRVVKAVAMLDLVQDEKHPTTADLVSRSVYDKLEDKSPLPAVQRALDMLVAEGFIGHASGSGYRIESSAGQEWQRERDGYVPTPEQISLEIRGALEGAMNDVDAVKVGGLPLAWLSLYTDGNDAREVRIQDDRKPTVLTVDFQLKKTPEYDDWTPRSDTAAYRDRVIWVAAPLDAVRHVAAKLVRSRRMVEIYTKKPSSDPERQRLLIQERNDEDREKRDLTDAVKGALLAGRFFFRGAQTPAQDEGASFALALAAYGARVAQKLYPNPVGYSVTEKELAYLVDSGDLAAPPPVFGADKLGLLSLDAGRYEVTCTGRVPQDVLTYLRESGGALTGAALIARLGGPPHGVPPDAVRAAVLGLLRARKIRVEIPGIPEMTSVRDEGARELLRDGGLRRAHLTENTDEGVGPRERNAICALLKEHLGKDVAREPDAIADAVAERFPLARQRLTRLAERFRLLPRGTAYPEALRKLEEALEACRRDRNVEPTMKALKRALPTLRDGFALLRRMESDLTDEAIAVIATANDVRLYEWPSLAALGASDELKRAYDAIDAHITTERPWEDAARLEPLAAAVRAAYRERRRAAIARHDQRLDEAVAAVKRRDDYAALDAAKRHQVLQHFYAAGAQTTEEAVAPPLESLDSLFDARRGAAEQKALLELDAFAERPTVEVALGLGGREIDSEAELDRLLADLRARIVRELMAKHRVRLKNG